MLQRIQKILSERGIASRRKAEEYIRQGLVFVNGAAASIGDKADPISDRIEVHGQVLQDRKEMLYYVLHKPRGVVTSNVERWDSTSNMEESAVKAASRSRRTSSAVPQTLRATTVRDLLPPQLQGSIYPVGRLDKDSSGLLLLTNDGALAYRLTHPRFEHEKEYVVTVDRPIDDASLQRMAEGMVILGSRTKEAVVQRIAAKQFRIALTEGKNRQIRRMCEKCGVRVQELCRTRIMTLCDATLQPGQLRPLSPAERRALLRSVGLNATPDAVDPAAR